MYKRINKRVQKREKEEAMGDDEETRENFGMHDSDESDSGSSSDSSRGSDDGSQEPFEVEPEEETGNNDGPEDEDDEPPMTVVQALSNPLYPAQGADVKACILCPGKELKHDQMASVHVASSTHLRRAKRFATLAARVGDDNEDPRLLVAALDESVKIAPREKVKIEPQMSKKDRRMTKRQRRRDRRAAAPKNEQSDHAITTRRDASVHSVIQAKLARKRAESVKRHKLANPQSHLRKTVRLKKSSI
ncbi:hypothetical protein FRC09_005230 [Ceratobasidium sp. 395]|nr:hypothetical protein FRC09_005230 [Ceratobasidium sp. 395]